MAIRLEQVGELVNRCGSGLLLVREALGEFAAVTLATLFKLRKFAERDTSVAPDTIEANLTAVKQLVQVRTAHPETLSGLVGRERLCGSKRDDLSTRATKIDKRVDDVEHLWRDVSSSALKLSELLEGNARSIENVHGNHHRRLATPAGKSGVNVTDETTGLTTECQSTTSTAGTEV